MQKINIPQDWKDKMQKTVDSAKDAIKDVKIQIPNIQQKNEPTQIQIDPCEPIKYISTECALTLIYYLIASDNVITEDEKNKFVLIGMELDKNFSKKIEAIITVCTNTISQSNNRLEAIQHGIDIALTSPIYDNEQIITPKLLIWDLLTTACSDSQYDFSEKEFIEYIVSKLDIEKAIYLEMENSILTLMDLDKEIKWIKTTNKQYLVIEENVNELENRKNTIFESIKTLIAL